MPKVLITGVTGFVGSHLAEYLIEKKHDVYGTIRWRSRLENIQSIKDKMKLVDCDMKDAFSVKKMIDRIHPEYVFQLAAQSYVPFSWHAPQETFNANVISEINLFEALLETKTAPLIHIAGSSEEYGLVLANETPIKEENPLRPLSPYGVSKVAQDLLGYQYFKSYGMKIIRTRAFNHTGPRRGDVFVSSNFAKQIAEIEKGIHPPVIFVGNLEAIRDFTDVRDVVAAYWLSLEKGVPGEVYNISSGKGRKISEVLEILLSLTKLKIEIRRDSSRMRPSDVALLIGDSSKFRKQTGWQPKIPFTKTLGDLLEFWRERV